MAEHTLKGNCLLCKLTSRCAKLDDVRVIRGMRTMSPVLHPVRILVSMICSPRRYTVNLAPLHKPTD